MVLPELVSEDRRNGSVMPWRGGWIYRSPSRPSASAASAQTSPSPIAMRATIAHIESRCQISTRTQPDTDEHFLPPRPATPPESGPPGIRGVARLPNCPGSNALQPTAIEALLRPSGEQLERALAEPGPAVGRGWISWNLPSLPVLDTARNGLLNVAGMDTLTALNWLPPITICAGPPPAHLVYLRCPGPEAQNRP